ncbi:MULTISPECIES: ABC transporter ATP-binding protein [Gordonibacter]|uniref:ABC transporter ATP-binding protein n=1 Tax=Gordonibacter faecis TaxID=3047475 RepID=A0ABT7DNC3_9ACTN|nr:MULTISPECIES: ABC transporter ATP-binding protein [unclassified Gordonibacter]MDJ1650058.1 ABC transporter ATP-binding protein [Gordonibacter sp. KGMB12511]
MERQLERGEVNGGCEKPPLLKLLDYAGSYKALTVVGCALSAVHAALVVAPLVLVWFVLSRFVEVAPFWGEAEDVLGFAVAAAALAALGVAVYFGALMCTHIAAFRTANNMRKAALRHLAKVPLGYFSTHPSGETRRIIDGCAGQTENVLAHKFPDFVGALVTPIAFFAVMFVFDFWMGLACLVPVLVSAICMWKIMGGGSSDENSNYLTFVRNYQTALNKMNAAATEYVRGMPAIKIFQQTANSFKAFRDSVIEYRDMAHGYSKFCEGPQIVQIVAINATFAVLVPVAILLAAHAGSFSLLFSNFLFYAVFSALTTSMMTKILYASEALAMAQDAVSRFEIILSEPTMRFPAESAARRPGRFGVEFDRVSFSYPGSSSKAVDDLSMSIPEGATVALVGPSGGGKTTIASLVPRFWDQDAGTITIGGVDTRQMAQKDLMDTVSFVFQNTKLFAASLLDNVRFSKPDATREDVERALRAARCEDIVAKCPFGLNTEIGPKGVSLSGGECQRVALARAILKDAPIVVLDEATAFADPENESLIQEALSKLTRGKTVLMIAHRLSTVVDADLICVVEAGKIAESGTHRDLLELGGTYSGMWSECQRGLSWKIGERGGYAA